MTRTLICCLPARLRALALLGGALLAGPLLAGVSGAQVAFTQLNLAGQTVQSIQLYGVEYASETVLRRLVSISRGDRIVTVTGLGHTLLLPLDDNQRRATTDFNTVQLDTERRQARSATLVNGHLYLPLDTLASGLGATYQNGEFTLPPAQLLGVSSRSGKDSDRLVLDLTRNVDVVDERRGSDVVLTLRGISGQARRYTTRGAFVPGAEVARAGTDLTLTVPLPATDGYRTFKVVRETGVRIVLDAGPGVPRSSPELLTRVTRPLIVLDPARVSGVGRDVTLDVARRAAELLSTQGWQVQVTRDPSSALSLDDTLKLVRQSDVYLALDLGRFPNAARSGVTVYEQTGRASAQIVNDIRAGEAPPYGGLIVAGTGSSRRLGDLLRGELKGGGVTARREGITRMINLGEAPQAAVLLELGWANNAADLANLAVDSRLTIMANAVARSVAVYLTARANNNANVSALTGSTP